MGTPGRAKWRSRGRRLMRCAGGGRGRAEGEAYARGGGADEVRGWGRRQPRIVNRAILPWRCHRNRRRRAALSIRGAPWATGALGWAAAPARVCPGTSEQIWNPCGALLEHSWGLLCPDRWGPENMRERLPLPFYWQKFASPPSPETGGGNGGGRGRGGCRQQFPFKLQHIGHVV